MNSSPTVAAAAANRMSPAAHRLRCPLIEPAKASIAKFVCNVFKTKDSGGGGGSRTRVRKCYWSRDYMLIRVHALGITRRRSRPPLRTDKKRLPLALKFPPPFPSGRKKTSPLCDV